MSTTMILSFSSVFDSIHYKNNGNPYGLMRIHVVSLTLEHMEEIFMSRLQIVIAVGLFLIVGLFGWQSYLDKRAQENESNRSDQRGIAADKVPGLQKHLDDAKKAKEKPKAPAENTEGAKEKVDAPTDKAEAPKPAAADTPKK